MGCTCSVAFHVISLWFVHPIVKCLYFLFSVGSDRQYNVKVDPVIGELLQAAQVSVASFTALQGQWVVHDHLQ